MTDKVVLPFTEISQRLKNLTLPEVDWIVGIATGGIVPSSLVAHQLGKPLTLLHIKYRAEDNSSRYEQPLLLADVPDFKRKKWILLVDGVSVTGRTLNFAKMQLSERKFRSPPHLDPSFKRPGRLCALS